MRDAATDPGKDPEASPRAPALRAHLLVLAVYAALTVAMTYPLPLRMGTSVTDADDPLFNTWVIAWNAHSLLSGQPRGLFDTNLFYPAPNTAAYSELLLPQSLVAAPILWLSDNPVLAHNVVLLLALVTSAFGAYLLGSYLTDRLGGFVAGLVFAFNPFMMNHLSHVQFLSAGGIPLAFLYLHKFLASGRNAHLLAFSAFYVLQSLANTHYALYLTFFAALYILAHVWWRRRYFDLRLWRKLGLHAAIAIAALGPFFFRYFALRRDFGMMIRGEESVATAASFLATSPINRLYGELTAAYFEHEAALFPGLCALALAAFGIWEGWKGRERRVRHQGPAWVPVAYRLTGFGLALLGIVVLEVLGSGGIDISLGPIPIRASSLRNPAVLILVLAALRFLLKRRYAVTTAISGSWDLRLPYVGMLALAAVLTIPVGLSLLIHDHVPGFEGMRSASRVHVMSMLAIAVLAAHGVGSLATRLGRRRGAGLAAALALVICIEYLSVPLPAVAVPTRAEAPELYLWLGEHDEDFAYVEYPILTRLSIWQAYFSTYHWKRPVTGASAFPSRTYIELVQRREDVPSPSTLRDLETIGVRYLVVHDWPSDDTDLGARRSKMEPLSDRLRLVATHDSYDISDGSNGRHEVLAGGRALVYELTRSDWRPPRLLRRPPSRDGAEMLSVDRSEWTLSASTNPDLLQLAVDGELSTRWYSLQQPGQYFQLDLGEEVLINGVVLDVSDDYSQNAPRGYRVEVSRDGLVWSTVAEDPSYRPPLTEFLRPRHYKADLAFLPVVARHVRVVQTGTDPDHRWSISEIQVTAPLAPDDAAR